METKPTKSKSMWKKIITKRYKNLKYGSYQVQLWFTRIIKTKKTEGVYGRTIGDSAGSDTETELLALGIRCF